MENDIGGSGISNNTEEPQRGVVTGQATSYKLQATSYKQK